METNQSDALTSALDQQQAQMDHLTDTIQSQMQTYLPFMMILSGLVVVVLLLNMFHKWRLERAILRIDKNLQKLVSQSDEKKPTSDIEQN